MEKRAQGQRRPASGEDLVGDYPTPEHSTAKRLQDTWHQRLSPLAWLLFTLMWLVFPIGFVIDVLQTELTPLQTFAFLVSMAALATVFLWLMLGYPFSADELTATQRRLQLGLLVVLAALALYVELAYAGGIPYRFVFVALAAGVTLPTRHGAWAVLATTVLASGIYALRSGWEASVLAWASVVIPFVAVGVSMIVVSRLVVTVRELRAAREEIARLAVAEERLRFARDLHDLLGHSLSQITLKSELARRLLPESPEKAAAEVQDIEGAARKSLSEVREAVSGYRKPTLDGELEGAREMLEAAGISWWIESRAGAMTNGTDAILGWAVREGVTNVIRHSRANRCQIRLTRENGKIRAEITDDGRGFDPGHESASNGNGLSGLAERIARSGGDFESGPLLEGGFRLQVSLPLNGGAAEAAEPRSKTDGTGEDGRR